MKIICHRETLLSACDLAEGAIDNESKPILRNLKLKAGDGLTVASYSHEVSTHVAVRGGFKIEEPGDALMPAKLMIEMLQLGASEEVEIFANDASRMISFGADRYELPSEFAADELPDVPAFAEEKYHEISAGSLREMIKRTIFAAATEGQVRFGATTGILWELEDDKAAMIATDGRRLAMMTAPAKPHGGHSTNGQLPVMTRRTANIVAAVLENAEEESQVKVAFRGEQVFISAADVDIDARLVEGRFPNYRQVIPQKANHLITVSPAMLAAAVRRAAILTNDNGDGVQFRAETSRLTLQSKSHEGDRAQITIPVQYDGTGVSIDFDPRWVLDVLAVLDPSLPVTLEVTAGDRPAVFKQGEKFIYVLVPLTGAA